MKTAERVIANATLTGSLHPGTLDYRIFDVRVEVSALKVGATSSVDLIDRTLVWTAQVEVDRSFESWVTRYLETEHHSEYIELLDANGDWTDYIRYEFEDGFVVRLDPRITNEVDDLIDDFARQAVIAANEAHKDAFVKALRGEQQ